jgi:hypothetical protein
MARRPRLRRAAALFPENIRTWTADYRDAWSEREEAAFWRANRRQAERIDPGYRAVNETKARRVLSPAFLQSLAPDVRRRVLDYEAIANHRAATETAAAFILGWQAAVRARRHRS